ncbi:BRO1 domain-containing protein BROX-like [Branchiostoma lanceolatum]|uniref:BRO1 domain-containing protein BROX-like n=1 Tax=Branchiostoma lanceolatum TaxID=7740 RepID=UPI00345329EA
MAHWFHRNPIKATAPVSFTLGPICTNAQTQKICSDLRMLRAQLLELLCDPNKDVTVVKTTTDNYFALLQGFLQALDDNSGESKLRHSVKFKWSSTVLSNAVVTQADALFELASMAMNSGLWYMKHAAKIAASDEVSMDEAKEVHKCLRTAAGIFKNVKEQVIGRLLETAEKGTDLDPKVVEAYFQQSTAEAQEVALARAVEMKHSAGLISSLSYETAQLFITAGGSLDQLDAASVGKWQKYLQLKGVFYLAHAHCFNGDALLAKDKCGDAIRALQESEKLFEKAESLCKEYASAKGPGTSARPDQHIFFTRLGKQVKITLDKCTRENGFIYFQKVPPEVPELEKKATYGLANPEEFQLPPPNPMWSADIYNSFDLSLAPATQKGEKEPEVKPVKETDIYQSTKEPGTFSGCVIS